MPVRQVFLQKKTTLPLFLTHTVDQ